MRPLLQIINEMSARLSREEFMAELHAFMVKRKTPITRIPTIGNKELDLYTLYYAVIDRGGTLRIL